MTLRRLLGRSSAVVLVVASASGCDAGSRSEPPDDASECESFCAFVPEHASPPEGSPVGLHGQLRVEGTAILGENGEPVQLKGVSSMWLNWETDGYAENRAALEWMRDHWNVSVVRAAMGVEAAGAYLVNPVRARRQVQRIVRNAIELGLYVIVDWHDHRAEAHEPEATAFFSELAQYYGAFPNLIYETYNEPLKVSWTDVIKPYHERVVAELRAIDPDNLIVLGTPQWSQLVDEAAADPLVGSNLMYTLHFYACEHTALLRERAAAALELGLPLFVTEWGATDADGGVQDRRVCDVEAQLWHDFLNEHRISWAAWKLDGCVEGSCLLLPGTPPSGPFSDDRLQGHGFFVRDRLRE